MTGERTSYRPLEKLACMPHHVASPAEKDGAAEGNTCFGGSSGPQREHACHRGSEHVDASSWICYRCYFEFSGKSISSATRHRSCLQLDYGFKRPQPTRVASLSQPEPKSKCCRRAGVISVLGMTDCYGCSQWSFQQWRRWQCRCTQHKFDKRESEREGERDACSFL